MIPERTESALMDSYIANCWKQLGQLKSNNEVAVFEGKAGKILFVEKRENTDEGAAQALAGAKARIFKQENVTGDR
jgi:hypothetical protein